MSKNIFSFFSKSKFTGAELKNLTPQMQAFLQMLPSAVLLLDETAKIQFVNPAAEKLLQRDAKTLLKMTLEQLGVSVDKLQALHSGDKVTKQVWKILAPQHPVFVTAGAEKLGDTPFVLLSLEESPLVQTLQAEKIFLDSVINGYPVAVTVQDVTGRCVVWNEQAHVLFGSSFQEAAGKTIYQLLPKKVAAAAHWMDEEVVAGKKRQEPVRVEYQSQDGMEKVLSLSKSVIPGGTEPVQFVVTLYEEITLHYEREQNLQRSQKLLEVILENIPLGIYTRDLDAKITFINQQGLQILGENPGTVERKHERQTQEESDSYIQRERQILKEGKTYEYPEEEYTDSFGNTRIVHMIKIPLQDAGPKPLVLTIVEDVTKRRAQEKEIQRVNGFLSAIVQNAPIALYARAGNGKMLLRNKQCLELFGNMEDKDFDERGGLSHETTEQVTHYLNREADILRKGQTLDIPEESYVTPRGDTKLLHLVKTPVLSGDTPEESCVITLVEDITSRKEQERALIESKNFLQTVINQLPVSLSVKNYAGRYILWNKKSEELFGVPAKEVIGRSAYRADLNQEQLEFLRENDLRVFESKKEQNIPQELISSAKEGIKIMHTVKTPVFNPDGSPNCLLVVSEDITAKTKMEKQIREASDKNMLLVENAREGVVILEDGKIIYANRAFCRILGFDNLEEIQDKMLLDFAEKDHQILLEEKYEAVRNGVDENSAAMDAYFVKKDGSVVEAKFAAVLAKYLGRRIVLGFVRDVTAANRALRDAKAERDHLRQVFEESSQPQFILSRRGYISAMNAACRELFGFKLEDKKFYCNVYIRPGITLEVRKQLKEGQPAKMDYTFDFAQVAKKFPDRLAQTTGQLNLSVSFVPVTKRDTKDGSVEADYLVSLQVKPETVVPPAPPKKKIAVPAAVLAAHSAAVKEEVEPQPAQEAATAVSAAQTQPVAEQPADPNAASSAPLPPILIREPQDNLQAGQLLLPNSEPYALCDGNFTITACNDLCCSLCGLTEEELVGQDIRRIFQPDELPLIEQDFRLLQEVGQISNREYTILVGSGLETCRVRLLGIKGEDGRFLFILHSLTFHLQIMQILEERSALLSALHAATDGGILRLTLQHNKLECVEPLNTWLTRKTGYSQEEIDNMGFDNLFAEPQQSYPSVALVLAQARKDLKAQGKASFHLPLRKKDGTLLEAQVALVMLDIPKHRYVLAVLQDITEQRQALSKDSKEAQELASLRQTLPGLYLKMNEEGKVLEVSSNLSYLNNKQAQTIFLSKTPDIFWPEEVASRTLFAVKEALSMRVSSFFEFEWPQQYELRYFEATVVPLADRSEVVLWVRDASEKRIYDRRLHDLYHLSQQTELDLTESVEKLLTLGNRIFQTEAGFIVRFTHGKDNKQSLVAYATSNPFGLERQTAFPVEECMRDLQDGGLVMHTDLSGMSCTKCIHRQKGFDLLLAAPLFMGDKVEGALCFAAKERRRSFAPGTEEMLGLMARLLGLRIELRQAGEMLGDSVRLFTRALAEVNVPALTINADLRITSVNAPLLHVANQRIDNLQGKDMFEVLIRHADISRQNFLAAVRQSENTSFCQVTLDLLQPSGSYRETVWDVFICKNAQGAVEGYALVAHPAAPAKV